MRRHTAALLCLGLAACGGHEAPAPTYGTAPPRDIPGEIKRNVDVVDDQVRFANNGQYNRFLWMTDGTFCYSTQSKAEIVRYCFEPHWVDAESIAVRSAASLGAPYDRVAFSCRGRACVKRSTQSTAEFGPGGYDSEGALSMPTRVGGAQPAAQALRTLLWLGSQPGAMPTMQ